MTMEFANDVYDFQLIMQYQQGREHRQLDNRTNKDRVLF